MSRPAVRPNELPIQWVPMFMSMKLTTHLHLVSRLVNEAIPLLPLYAFMAWTRTALLFTFTSTFPTYSLHAFLFSPHMFHMPC